MDEKYVVFKLEDYEAATGRNQSGDDLSDELGAKQLDDFVVIRLQDTFAPSALYNYAANVQTVMEIHYEQGDVMALGTVLRMEKIRDFLFEKAQQSQSMQRKLPD